MDKNEIIKAIKLLKESSPKRNFKQIFDMVINLKGLDMKKPDNQVEFFANLHFSRGRKISVCAFVGPELKPEAEKFCDEFIDVDHFDKYAKDKKLAKKLAEKHTFFIAQADIMPRVAAAFGKVLGPRGKMPNPKAGCVVPPKAALKPLYDRLQKVLKISAKTSPIIQCPVGSEDMPEEEVADNIMVAYDQLIHHLPKDKNNIRNMFVKMTMSGAIKFDDNGNIIKKDEPEGKAKKK
jgi:large subunit ribosomal protein L1